jgi:nicotinamidase-related amidase
MESTQARASFEALALRPAVVTIDLHRGHLDPATATLPLPADASAALVERVVPLLDEYRVLGVPVIHVVTAYRDRNEILSNRYWRFQAGDADSPRRQIAEHNLIGMPGLELMPGIEREGDAIVPTKKRYDCFVGTDLDFRLQAGGHDSVLVLGVNTNSCVLATSIAASVRDYAVFVVEEGVDTMLGPKLHDAGLAVIDASFGWVISAKTTLDALSHRARERMPSVGARSNPPVKR